MEQNFRSSLAAWPGNSNSTSHCPHRFRMIGLVIEAARQLCEQNFFLRAVDARRVCGIPQPWQVHATRG
jgi:hypothetical protein